MPSISFYDLYPNIALSPAAVDALKQIARSVAAAEAKHKPYNSFHETYGVLAEEVDEFFDDVKADNHAGALRELADIGAVAVRALAHLSPRPVPAESGSEEKTNGEPVATVWQDVSRPAQQPPFKLADFGSEQRRALHEFWRGYCMGLPPEQVPVITAGTGIDSGLFQSWVQYGPMGYKFEQRHWRELWLGAVALGWTPPTFPVEKPLLLQAETRPADNVVSELQTFLFKLFGGDALPGTTGNHSIYPMAFSWMQSRHVHPADMFARWATNGYVDEKQANTVWAAIKDAGINWNYLLHAARIMGFRQSQPAPVAESKGSPSTPPPALRKELRKFFRRHIEHTSGGYHARAQQIAEGIALTCPNEFSAWIANSLVGPAPEAERDTTLCNTATAEDWEKILQWAENMGYTP